MEKLLYKDYVGDVKFSNEDNCYYGNIQNVNGLFMYDGENIEELTQNFRETVDYLIENQEVCDSESLVMEG